MIWLNFAVMALTSGVNAVCVKLAQKVYVRDTPRAFVFTFCFAASQSLLLFALPPYGRQHFTVRFTAYPIGYGAFFLVSQLLLLNALKRGPMALTNILLRYHLLVPIFAGLCLWDESLSLFTAGGLALFLASVYFFQHDNYDEGGVRKPILGGWLATTLLATLSSGLAVIFTKQYMRDAAGSSRDYLILFNLFIAIFSLGIIGFRRLRGGKVEMPGRRFLLYVFLAALATDIANLIFMNYVAKLPTAFFMPAVGLLSSLGVLVLSYVLLRERISRKAWVGVALSLAAICLLSL